MICKDGTREDEGILRKDSDGRYWISSSREAGDKWSDQLAQMGDGEESLIREIEAVVDQGIKRDMKSGHVRRMAIAAAVTGAGKAEKTMDDKMEEVSGLMSEAKAAAERNGTDAHDEIAKDLDAFHSITGIPTPLAPLFSRPLFARFAPSFRRSFAVSGFLAPRRRERAKDGVKWAKSGGETAEKQR